MENWITASLPILIKVIITVVAIFSIIILITRISGLRTFAKMSSFDFASTIAIGSILASVILNTNQSIVKASVALIAIVSFQSLFSFLNKKSNFLRKGMTNTPLLLMREGKILYDNLKKANVDITDLVAKLREANVLDFSEVRAVVFESTGDISVLHTKEADKKLSNELLRDVREN